MRGTGTERRRARTVDDKQSARRQHHENNSRRQATRPRSKPQLRHPPAQNIERRGDGFLPALHVRLIDAYRWSAPGASASPTADAASTCNVHAHAASRRRFRTIPDDEEHGAGIV
jgi:hypothetical protein